MSAKTPHLPPPPPIHRFAADGVRGEVDPSQPIAPPVTEPQAKPASPPIEPDWLRERKAAEQRLAAEAASRRDEAARHSAALFDAAGFLRREASRALNRAAEEARGGGARHHEGVAEAWLSNAQVIETIARDLERRDFR
jgi:hypothetical protein